ncbi:MAG: threonine--tRNA ligase [Clostridiales bacterium]|nr:threonine--tRNA ligase [Clostridiales bacterium]
MKITLKDGSIREFEPNITALDVVRDISEGLARVACAVKIDGTVMGLSTPIDQDIKDFIVLKFEDDGGADTYRHTASHIMANAVKRLFPDAKIAIGPAIENGFYYDFDVDTPFTPDDLVKIENEMEKIIAEKKELKRFELSRFEAIQFMKNKNEPYKVELIEDLPEDAVISFYEQGDFVDLCAGPHLPDTGRVRSFKLLSVAGAYWRGSEKNKMLQRIYGTAFDNKKDLKKYLNMLEEAKKRDHRKLGKELELFALLEEGPGFPFFLPKGMVIKNLLIDYWRDVHNKAGYVEISTPIILSRELWETSGHWEHYMENMYTTQIDERDFAIKPMNCPGGMLVYKQKPHSYKEFPIRAGELGLVHRHEMSGVLHGLMRVRQFTQDDAHIFMLPGQIKDEIKNVIKLIDEVYKVFGFKYHMELSTRPEKSIGRDEDWEVSTQALRDALEEEKLEYILNEGDGAFYGPKIDFHLEDCIGRTWQCGTIQLDFQLPERFELEYIGADGHKHRPVMIHRVVYGSIERFLGILIEHYAGAFPVWLSPIQAKVLTITDRNNDCAEKVVSLLKENGIRTEIDTRNEKIGFKIREARNERVPYIAVIGDMEVENNTLSVKMRNQKESVSMHPQEMIDMIQQNIADKQ